MTHRKVWLWTFWAVAALLAIGFIGLARSRNYHSGDTGYVVSSTHAIIQCMRVGTWSHCPGVTQFPPLQFIIATIAVYGGSTDQEAYNLLGALSLEAYFVLLGLTALLFWGRDGRLRLVAAGLIGSYAINYAASPFGEMLAACAGTALVVLIQRRWWVLAAVAALVFTLTKDIAAPLALALGIASLPIVPGEGWGAWLRRNRRPIAILAVGCLLGTAVSSAFNYFRYGSLQNTHLLNPDFRVQHLGQHLLHVVALFVAPAGGMLEVAPLLVVVVVAVAWAGRAGWRTPEGAQRWFPLAFTVAVSFGLASWYTPLGWWAWGARLSLPWLVPAFVLAVATMPPGTLEGPRWRVALILTAPLVVLNSAMLAAPRGMFRYFETHVCYGGPNSDPFFACLNQQVFSLTDSLTVNVAKALAEPSVMGIAAVHVAVVAALLVSWGWRSALASPSGAPPVSPAGEAPSERVDTPR